MSDAFEIESFESNANFKPTFILKSGMGSHDIEINLYCIKGLGLIANRKIARLELLRSLYWLVQGIENVTH